MVCAWKGSLPQPERLRLFPASSLAPPLVRHPLRPPGTAGARHASTECSLRRRAVGRTADGARGCSTSRILRGRLACPRLWLRPRLSLS